MFFAAGVGYEYTWCHRCGKYFGYYNPDKKDPANVERIIYCPGK